MDGQTLAGRKIQAGKSQLSSELYRIEREQKAEMRMHNTVKQRFRAKYSRLDIYTDRGKDAADVRLYETHNPGFCYRRNGECRIPQAPMPSPSVDFNDIHSLLFTDGEVDIEKVLCLHLLTAHRTETLTPPARYHRALSFMAKDQSPLERLIERSRKKRQEDSVSKLLPTYILDVKTRKPGEEEASKKSEVMIRDGRLAARVIINDKIVQLVHTVIAALQHTNPEKMNELVKLAKDTKAMKAIIEKPHIQKFLNTLNGQTLVYSCESFHLTQPFKATTVPLEIETTKAGLEKLVNHIRKNVLQFPAQSTWKSMYHKSQSGAAESVEDMEPSKANKKPKDANPAPVLADVPPGTFKTNFVSKNRESVGKPKSTSLPNTNRESRRAPSRTPRKKNDDKNSLSIRSSDTKKKHPSYMNLGEEKQAVKKSLKTKIKNSEDDKSEGSKKNTKGGESQNTGKNESRSVENADKLSGAGSEKEIKTTDADLFKKMDLRAVAAKLSEKVLTAHKRDLEQLNKDTPRTEKTQIALKPDSKPVKASIKQVTCPACVEKWKIPLPNPKTSSIKKVALPTLDQYPYNEFRSGSTQKLSMLIEEEMKKLNAEDRNTVKAEKKNFPSLRTYKNMARGNLTGRRSVDTVDLDVLDLARITQEIKEKETQKKLSKFLENKI